MLRPVRREQIPHGADGACCGPVNDEAAAAGCAILSAASIWHLCDGTRTVREIVVCVADATGYPADELRGDIEQTIRRLHAMNLIDLQIGPPAVNS